MAERLAASLQAALGSWDLRTKAGRLGRRNRYILSLDRPLRHPLEANTTIAEIIRVIEG